MSLLRNRRAAGAHAVASAACAAALGACDASQSASVQYPELLIPREQALVAFADPQTECVGCHSQHVREWEMSNHAYAAVDPVFHAMVSVGQEATKGKLGQFCVQCHTPTGMALGETQVTMGDDGVARQDLTNLRAVARQGVSCDVCHTITQVMEPVNARMIMTPDGVRRATIADPVPTSAHASAYSELHASSDVCSGCHAVINPRGAFIEETFGEWADSSAAAAGKQCQDCHMPEYEGVAAKDGPVRTVHRHTFVGVDVSLLPEDEFPGYHEIRALAAQMLKSAVDMQVHFDPDDPAIVVDLQNLAGHALPSGATAERQMWIEIIVRDDDGQQVYASGLLDANGDLFEGVDGHSLAPGSDPDLAYFGQQLVSVPKLATAETSEQRAAILAEVEAACRPQALGAVDPDGPAVPVPFPWQADWQCNSMIPPDGSATVRYPLAGLEEGFHSATVRLLFRTFPPYFLRELERLAGLDPAVKDRVPIVEMATAAVGFRR